MVDFVLNLEEAEKNLTIWQAEKARLNAKYGTEGHSLMVFLQNEIIKHRDKIEEDERKEKLKRQIEQFRACMKNPEIIGNKIKISSVVGELQYLYGSFNNDLFEAEMNDVLAEEIEEVGDLEKTYQTTNGHIGKWVKKLKTLWESVDQVFVNNVLPSSFRIHTVTPQCSKEDVARSIVLNFVKDWRLRATRFDRPVSIYGTDINSMPKERQKVWWEAYKKLGLNDNKKYPKRPIYWAVQSKEKDPTYIQDTDLTGKFGLRNQ